MTGAAPFGVRVAGWGVALPDRVVTNADLEARLDTSDAWISERTGIRERRVGESTVGLAVAAAHAAMVRAGVGPDEVDHVLLATTTPDHAVPASASIVQHALGVPGGAADLNAACSGFVYGLVHATGLLGLGLRRVLLIGAETMSRIIDWDDRDTAVLFGDGAGAVVLEAGGGGALLGWDLGSDGGGAGILYADHGDVLRMEGREVFRRAVRATVASSQRALDRAGVGADEITVFLPHQANARIIEAAAVRLGIPAERTAVNVHATGNTSAASIPIVLAAALDEGRIDDGALVLVSGFGAGMAWGSAVLRWDSPGPGAARQDRPG